MANARTFAILQAKCSGTYLMRKLSISVEMQLKQESCKNGNTPNFGTIPGDLQRYPSHGWNEETVYPEEGKHREVIRNGERESWIAIFPDDRISPNGNESRADICMHEFKEAGKNEESQLEKVLCPG